MASQTRFRIQDLVDISKSLSIDEQAIAEYLNDESESISRMPWLFADNVAPTSGSGDVFLNLRAELQVWVSSKRDNASAIHD